MDLVKCLLLVGCALVWSGCERMPSDSPATATVSVRLEPAGPAAVAGIQLFVLKISAEDMDPILLRRELLVDSTTRVASTDTVTVAVPVGRARRFQLFLLDASGATTHYAETTADIPRGDAPLSLSLRPEPPPLVRVILSHGITDAHPLDFFKEWIDTQVRPRGYRVDYDSTGFNLLGADLVVIPKPNSDSRYTTTDSDDLLGYLQTEGGAALFLGDATFGGDLSPLPGPYGFGFGSRLYDSLQFIEQHGTPVVTQFADRPPLGPGDTLILYGGVECTTFVTGMPAVVDDTLARLSAGGYTDNSDPLVVGGQAVALLGIIDTGRFAAVGDLDWLGPTGTVTVGDSQTPVAVGIGAYSNARLAALILTELVPIEFEFFETR